MSEQDRNNQLRKEILFQAYGRRPVAVSVESIHRECQKQRFDFLKLEIERELSFLCDRNLIFKIEDKLGTAHLFRIHADGVAYYEQNYAA